MHWFEAQEIVPTISNEDMKWMIEIGNNIKNDERYKNYTIKPHLITAEERHRLSYIFSAMPVDPIYAAIIMTPKFSICKTHIDDRAAANNLTERITVINIPLQVHETSIYQFMEDMDSEVVIGEVDLQTPKCWKVDIPHRVDNSKSPHDRLVFSLSFSQTIEELHEMIKEPQ